MPTARRADGGPSRPGDPARAGGFGVLAVLAVLAGALTLAGTENGFSTLYNGFDAGGEAQQVEGDARRPNSRIAVAAPVTRVERTGSSGQKRSRSLETILAEAGFEVEKKSRETSGTLKKEP